MNIYDFDGTIYDGDSSIDFFKYCLKRKKKIILLIPRIILSFILYMLKIKNKEYFKGTFFSFLKYFDDVDIIVDDFWTLNDHKIKEFYLNQKKNNDIIISASPFFLLEPIAKLYNFKLIATNVDKKTGIIMGNNCHGQEKVNRLQKENINNCDNFYSDSLSDLPVAKISNKAYIVSGENIIPWNNYHENFKKRLSKFLFDRDFVVFVFIGLINVFNGVVFAIIYSYFIKNLIVAYMCGFISSLIVAYILNSLLNFKKKLSFNSLFRSLNKTVLCFCI